MNVNSQDWAAWQVYAEDGVTLLPVDEHPVRQAALTGKAVRNKTVGVRLPAGGDLTWMTINAEPTLNPDGTLQYLIATYYDITERKEAEEAIQLYSRELENHRNNLEELVKQRTEELQTLSHRLIMVQEEERRSLSRELHDQTGRVFDRIEFAAGQSIAHARDNEVRGAGSIEERQRIGDSGAHPLQHIASGHAGRFGLSAHLSLVYQ